MCNTIENNVIFQFVYLDWWPKKSIRHMLVKSQVPVKSFSKRHVPLENKTTDTDEQHE